MKSTLTLFGFFFIFLSIVSPVYAWDGTDETTGDAVVIEKGNLVRSGNEIEVYDQNSGDYKNVTVDSVARSGGTVEVEVTDESGNSHTLKMEDR